MSKGGVHEDQRRHAGRGWPSHRARRRVARIHGSALQGQQHAARLPILPDARRLPPRRDPRAPGHPQGVHDQRQDLLEFLDGTGIESTVLYPTAGLAFSMIQDPTWAVPLARAYNNWFTDKFHKASPQRLKAVALVPIQDMPEAVQELRRAVTELGMGCE